MHRHICNSRFPSGPRVRTHYDDRCTEPYETDCLSCHDEELAAQGAIFMASAMPEAGKFNLTQPFKGTIKKFRMDPAHISRYVQPSAGRAVSVHS